jgi:DNA-binding PadR family transcriptional regulator
MEHEDSEQWGSSWHGHMFRGWHGMQAKRGDMSPILLRLLVERPMHGYEIIRELEKKSHGMWRPSPGSVYPTLQLLEEQDLVTSSEEKGKKVYTITEAGEAQAKDTKTRGPWEWHDKHHNMEQIMETRGRFMEFAGTFKQIMKTGSETKQNQALDVLKEATEKIKTILEAD